MLILTFKFAFTSFIRFASTNQHKIKSMIWFHTAKDDGCYNIQVSGQWFSEKDGQALKQELLNLFPDMKVSVIISDTVVNNLSGIIVEKTCNPYSDQVTWIQNGKATCEIILRGIQPHKENRMRLFCVTSAHLLLRRAEMLRLESPEPGCNQDLLMREIRGELLKRTDRHVYTLELANQQDTIHLTNLTLIAYWVSGNSTSPKSFMTDIAILPIEEGNVGLLKRSLLRNECKLTSIMSIAEELLQQLVERQIKVFAKNREGRLVPMQQNVEGDNPGILSVGTRISFIVDRGHVDKKLPTV